MIEEKVLLKVGKRILKEQKASITMLQRLYRFDYPKAKEYIDKLCELNVIKKRKEKYKVILSPEDKDLLYNNIFVDKYKMISRCDNKDNSQQEIGMAQTQYGFRRSKIEPYYDRFFKDLRKFNRLKRDYCPYCEDKIRGRVFSSHTCTMALLVYEDQCESFKEQFGQFGIEKSDLIVCPKCGRTWHNITFKSNPNMNKFYIFNAKGCKGEEMFEEPYLEALFKDDPTRKELNDSDVITQEEDLPF